MVHWSLVDFKIDPDPLLTNQYIIYWFQFIIYIYIYIYIFKKKPCWWIFHCYIWLSQLGLQNTPTASLQRGKTPPNKCPGYHTKQSDGEAPGMQSTPSLPSLPGPLLPRVNSTWQGPLYGSNRTVWHSNCVLMLNITDHLTVCKQMTDV